MSLPDGIIAYQGEVMLLQWSGSTSRTGPKLVLQLPDDDALENFRSATVAKGGRAGQRFAVVFVQIDDDETPVVQTARQAIPKGGWVSRDAAGYCNSETFRFYVADKRDLPRIATADEAAEYLRGVCGVQSRAELDHDADAESRYKGLQRAVSEWAMLREDFR